MKDKLFLQLGYVPQEDYVSRKDIENVVTGIQLEIGGRPNQPNMGKLGCLRRLLEVLYPLQTL